MSTVTTDPPTALNASLSENGIITDLAHLLSSRHWAQGLKLFSRHAARNMLLGNVRSRFRGRGMEFEEVRRYQAGDDIRTIDWKVSARAQGTFTKLFCEERERPCHIIVDQRSPLFFGSTGLFKSVLAAHVASAIAWAALKGGDRVGGQVIGDYVERDSRAKHSKQSVLRFIHDINELNHTLLNVQQAPSHTKSTLANSLEECRRITRPGTAVFIISDFHDFDTSAAHALRNLAKNTDLSVFNIGDPLEKNLPLFGGIAISDGLQSNKVHVTKSLQQDYQNTVLEKGLLLKDAATQARALYAELSTDKSAQKSLIALFTRST